MRSRRRRGGFTLIEVMVALVVTVLGLIAVTGTLMASMHGTSYARHATEATVLAEDKLEMLILTPLSQLASGTDRVDPQGQVRSTDGFVRTWTVDWDGNLARIAVAVAWHEGDGDRELTFRTVRAR